jgi:cupin fold WbuC family metalloprotein
LVAFDARNDMKQIDTATLQTLSARAAASARRRQNHNLHPVLEDPVQRLLNAIEPGTYVRPHRHPQSDKWELFVILSGRAAVLTFEDAGRVRERVELAAGGPVYVAEIPARTWHTLVALAPGTVLLEVKAGPYIPAGPEDFASWAPAEGAPASGALQQWFIGAHPGDRWP